MTLSARRTRPVPIVTHVHGAVGVHDDSDGYAEAWYLLRANDIPAGYATEGTWYDFFAGKAARDYGVSWGPGFAPPSLISLSPVPTRRGHHPSTRFSSPVTSVQGIPQCW
jgi:hypothetical protein